jgi:hypothetical protein
MGSYKGSLFFERLIFFCLNAGPIRYPVKARNWNTAGMLLETTSRIHDFATSSLAPNQASIVSL